MNTFNRLAVTYNSAQGSKLKVLCVCSAGILRSPTAANILHKAYGYNTRAVGVNQEYALIPLESVHLHWADEIVCMEKEHAREIGRLAIKWDYKGELNIVVLDIPDIYKWMDPKLQDLIKSRYLEVDNDI